MLVFGDDQGSNHLYFLLSSACGKIDYRPPSHLGQLKLLTDTRFWASRSDCPPADTNISKCLGGPFAAHLDLNYSVYVRCQSRLYKGSYKSRHTSYLLNLPALLRLISLMILLQSGYLISSFIPFVCSSSVPITAPIAPGLSQPIIRSQYSAPES